MNIKIACLVSFSSLSPNIHIWWKNPLNFLGWGGNPEMLFLASFSIPYPSGCQWNTIWRETENNHFHLPYCFCFSRFNFPFPEMEQKVMQTTEPQWLECLPWHNSQMGNSVQICKILVVKWIIVGFSSCFTVKHSFPSMIPSQWISNTKFKKCVVKSAELCQIFSLAKEGFRVNKVFYYQHHVTKIKDTFKTKGGGKILSQIQNKKNWSLFLVMPNKSPCSLTVSA